MPNFDLSRKLSYPRRLATTEWGVWLQDFLYRVGEEVPAAQRAAVLEYVFRWLVAREGGKDRLSEEEVQSRRERFYAYLPAELRPYFPWPAPEPLPPQQTQRPAYPRYHTPFRQYGFLATEWVEALSRLDPPTRQVVGAQLTRYLLETLRSHKQPVEEETLLEHLYLLSGEKVRLTAVGQKGGETVGSARENSQGGGDRRPWRRGRRPFRRRR